MTNQVPREVLLKVVKLIKQWHDMDDTNQKTFKIYYDNAPEMKIIRNTLGAYDDMKNEVISATSETVSGGKKN